MSSADDRLIKILEEFKIICNELGWDMLIDLDNEIFHGIHVGYKKYLDKLINDKLNWDHYSHIPCDEEVSETIH